MSTVLPSTLLDSLEGLPGFDREQFVRVHEADERVTSIRMNPAKPVATLPFAIDPVPWSPLGYYLPSRPSFTFDPLFHAGAYYVQEASSMFIGQAFHQTQPGTEPLRVLDLCAAPGGKSTHLHSLFPPGSLLVSNEVIRARSAILKDNIIKWGGSNVVVTQNDPADFSKLPGYFDVILVDAPCSGSGLFRRDAAAIDEWSLQQVQVCAQRQQRILADCWPALKENGTLIYSTCSYSREEDEAILDWLSTIKHAEPVSLAIDPSWGIVEVSTAKSSGYRFWPDHLAGEGFFLGCIRKTEPTTAATLRTSKQKPSLSRKEAQWVEDWMDSSDSKLIRHEQTVYAWPAAVADEMDALLATLRVIYSGVKVGELVHNKLVPDHALAMSRLPGGNCARTPLDLADAIRFLQRKELSYLPSTKGWQLACYQELPLGWMNVLSNRINNYYPKELRILKESPGLR